MMRWNDLAETYARDGAVAVPGVFRDWIAPLTAAAERVIDLSRSPGFKATQQGHLNPLSVHEDFGGGIMALNMAPLAEEFSAWQWRSPAAEIVGEVMRSDVARFWVDATFIKTRATADEATPWHNDVCTWPFWGDRMAILWIALTDVDMDNAPLLTLVGSHRGHQRYHSWMSPKDVTPPPEYRPWQELLDRTTAADAEIKAWTLEQGDCLVVHPGTIHASLPRRASAGRRFAFSTRWLGDDVAWKPDPLTEPMTSWMRNHPSMRFGAPPPDDLFPAVWRRGAGLQSRPSP
jgi:hypothetical protein